MIRIKIGAGEAIDRLTILQIKSEKITDYEKQMYVSSQLAELVKLIGKETLTAVETATAMLYAVNRELWEVEDKLRALDSQTFDAEGAPSDVEKFRDWTYLARSVYNLNDQRSALKNQIDDQLGTGFQEVKSYEAHGNDQDRV